MSVCPSDITCTCTIYIYFSSWLTQAASNLPFNSVFMGKVAVTLAQVSRSARSFFMALFFHFAPQAFKCNIRVHFNAKTYVCQCVWILGEKWCGDKFLDRPVSKLRMNVGLGCGYTACKKLRGILAYIEYSNYM